MSKITDQITAAVKRARAAGYKEGYLAGHKIGVLEGKAQPPTVVNFDPKLNLEAIEVYSEKMMEILATVSINHAELAEKTQAVLTAAHTNIHAVQSDKVLAVLEEMVGVLKSNGSIIEANTNLNKNLLIQPEKDA
jgi:predicted nucleotide-binding protein (sugar kinase/HSP70/actin superfamily)